MKAWKFSILFCFTFIPPCLAQNFDVTVNRDPDYRDRWPTSTTERWTVRGNQPYGGYGYCSPYGGYAPYGYGGNYVIDQSLPFVSPLTHPGLYRPQPGIVLNTPSWLRVQMKHQARMQNYR